MTPRPSDDPVEMVAATTAAQTSTKDNYDATDTTLAPDIGVSAQPGPHDVLCGRGGGTNNHAGNIAFRKLVQEHKLRYLAASKMEKPQVARDVVHIWRKLDPPGRFLARKTAEELKQEGSSPGKSVWYDVGDKRAREKASQCLRERTPDVVHIVREIQRQQDYMTQQGLLMVEQQLKLQQQQKQQQQQQPNGATSSDAFAAAAAAQQQQHQRQLQQLQQQQQFLQMQRQQMNDADLQNAFSVEHFFTHGFQNGGGPGSGIGRPGGSANNGASSGTSSSAAAVNGTGASNHHHPNNSKPKNMNSNTNNDPLSLEEISQNGDWSTMAAHRAAMAMSTAAGQPQHQSSSAAAGTVQPQHAFSSADLEPLGFIHHLNNTGTTNPDSIISSNNIRGSGSNNNNNDELTLEEYMESMKQFKAYHVDNDEKHAGRTNELLSMQDQSWIQSFHSVESNPSVANTAKSAISISSGESNDSGAVPIAALYKVNPSSTIKKTKTGKSLDKIRKQQLQPIHNNQTTSSKSGSSHLSKMGQSTRTHLSAKSAMSTVSNVSAKSARSNMSGIISLFSEDSRGSKMSKARDLNSNISMMSDFTELTDLSDAMNHVDLCKE
eukprot:CAMPEP_0202446432 /NCGR_PEP_ID=MMETSP1360-20130828/4913_1 /ASSEMBLY_ACC=CAM_ASM_000848 /TAXON_ID=515479 /ORGANISM="Licmophora paradoxa, Strain CCMP2313" /LENGTH=604 /DNA_ID=CAMNT_0049062893 /DNA_START=113 /DNA_END=1927 /DNA_ORIENTATION=-